MRKALRHLLMTVIVLAALVLPAQATSTDSTLSITKQPVTQTVKKGQNVTVSFTAQGEELTYRWYYKNSGEKTFTYTTLFTGASYTVEMSSTTDGRQVYCVVTDKNGASVQTDTVTLRMGNALKITKQPQSVTVAKKSKAKVTVSAEGEGLKYQWYYKSSGSSKYKKSSITSSTYTTTMKSSRHKRKIYCVITDKWGNKVQTDTVTLYMDTTLKIKKQPKSVAAYDGAKAKVTVKASGKKLKYQWYYKNPGSTSFKKSSVKKATYSTKMSAANSGRQVYCVIKDKYGSTVTTKTVTLTKANKLKITSQPKSQLVAKGNRVEVKVAAQGDGLTYQWYYKNKGSFKYKKSSIKKSTYAVTMSSKYDGRKVYCVIKDKYGKSVKTKKVTLTMGTPLKITKQPVSVIAPKNGAIKTFVVAQGDGLKYQWYYKDKGSSKYKKSSIKKSTYSTTMTSDKAGRKIYCVITDKRGDTVKTNTVTLTMGTPASIVTQPTSVETLVKQDVKFSISAKGDGLTYQWYYKNKDASSYTKDASAKSATYTIDMTKQMDGRSVYCVVADAYGNQVKSNVVTITLKHVWDNGKVTREPTCSLIGKKTFTCSDCGEERIEDIETVAHTMGEYKIYREPTIYLEGVERAYCKHCTYYIDRNVDKRLPTYYITVNTGLTTYKLGVDKDGKYTLEVPEGEDGYSFTGWKGADGKAFPESGTISGDCTVTAQWDVTATTTMEQLKDRLENGIDRVRIGADILISEPMFVSREVTLYADGDYTLKRDPGYNGDLFVIGVDKNGVTAVEHHREAKLNLGGGKGTLTIDGNRGKMNVTVKGSALYVSDSAVLNLYDGARVANHEKTGNQRVLNIEYLKGDHLERVGGAAIVNISATVNMYGGSLENNIVTTKYTTVTENGSNVEKEIAGCGGAVYNNGNFNMYGGTISGNEALRGGGLYNARIVNLVSGTITNNYAHTYGGGISTSATSYADTFLGGGEDGKIMLISNNRSDDNGGGLYSNTHSPLVICANTVFDGNTSATAGGAIHTAGPLTVVGATFKNNTSTASGGAIYHFYGNPSVARRFMSLADCVFENNSASLGGAVIFSAVSTATEGTVGTIENCSFIENHAVATENSDGSGGAIYITRESEVTVTGCNFQGNTSAKYAGGISAQSGSVVNITDTTFQENTAVYGGGMYVANEAAVTLTNVAFTKNAAVLDSKQANGHGGAMYLGKCPVTLKNVTMTENTAQGHGGAVYQNACTMTVDETCSFQNNHADGHGGALYLTYSNDAEGNRIGSVLNATGTAFTGNSALAGGAISVRSDCQANLTTVTLENNSATGTAKDASGGAIYAGYGTLNMTDVTAKGNTSAGHGGVVVALQSAVVVNGGIYENNEAPSGGVFTGSQESSLSLTNAELKGNKSTSKNTESSTSIGGGAINWAGNEVTITGCTFDGNSSGYYGGTILVSSAKVTINGNTVVKNSSAKTGGAFSFFGAADKPMDTTLDSISVIDNTATANGVIYQNNGILNVTNVAASGNKANKGGVLYVSGAETQLTVKDGTWENNQANVSGGAIHMSCKILNVENLVATGNKATDGGVLYIGGGEQLLVKNCTWQNNQATGNGGAIYLADKTLNVENVVFTENTAANGGAVYNRVGTLLLKDVDFTKNTATKNGGAMSVIGAELTEPENVTFTDNSAGGHGGAVYVSYTTVKDADGNDQTAVGKFTWTGGSFVNNTAMAGGAVSVRADCEATFDGTVFTGNSVTGDDGTKADGNGEGGGAIYVGYGKLTLKDATFNGNTAEVFGGAIASAGSEITVTGGTFENNEAASGGAVHVVEGGNVTVSGTTLTGNKSTYVHTDGYLYNMAGGVIQMTKGKLEVTNCTMNGNTSAYYGGAISTSKTEVTITDSTIQNTTGATGGVLCFRESDVLVKNVDITKCTATGSGMIYANGGEVELDDVAVTEATINTGILYASSSEVTVKNCAWSPVAAKNGGALYQNGGTVEITGMDFTGFSAESNGGAIYLKTGTLKLNECTFAKNTANNGGAIYNEGGTLQLNKCDFTENTSRSGGALYTRGGSVAMTDVNFSKNASTKNDAGQGGNAGAVMNSGAHITGNANFTENSAEGHGGAIYVSYFGNGDGTNSYGKMELEDSTFDKNTAITGGAISSRTGSDVKLTDCMFTANEASGTTKEEGGGAIFTNDNTLTITGCTFDGNKTGSYGGTISAFNCELTINGESVVENSEGVTGNALYFRGDKGEHKLENVTISDNVATSGYGVVYITNAGTLSMKNVTGTGNQNDMGGILYASGSGNIDIEDCEFTENTALNNGGVLCITSTSKVTVKDTVFEENTAKLGGAIHVGGTANVLVTGDKTSFKGNSAKNGGAVNLDGGAVFEMTGGTMDGNQATAGSAGAVYVTDTSEAGTAATTLKLTNVTVENHTATARGGAIATDGTSPNLVIQATGSTFHKNTTGAGGGAVAILNGNCTSTEQPEKAKIVFTNCTFTENSCAEGNSGGAIEVRSQSYVKLDGITAKKNSSPANGGVVYVTSNNSRLFLTGEVVLENNTAKSGTFAHMYNDKSKPYDNPPTIYTTHPETAEWYSQVKGNTNVAWNMETLP